MSKRIVKFLRPSGVYSPGDVAAIPSYQAKKLEGRGVVEFHVPERDQSPVVQAPVDNDHGPASVGAAEPVRRRGRPARNQG